MSGCSHVKQPHSSKAFYLMLFRHLLFASNAQSWMMQLSSKFKLHFYLPLMVDMLIIWMIDNLVKHTLGIDYRFIIVNIYKLFIVVRIIHVLIVLTHRNISVNRKYTTCEISKRDSSLTYKYAISIPLLSPYCPLTVHSLCHQ